MFRFGEAERLAAARLIEAALAEDLGIAGDLTSAALIDVDAQGAVNVVARAAGVLSGAPIARMVFAELDSDVQWTPEIEDGASVSAGVAIAKVCGRVRSLLTGERTALNFLTHLSGVASLTRRFVDAIAGTKAVVLDTRKTLPAWRVLQKYAVRCGGGVNHRMGLFDGVLIKDNHLAARREAAGDCASSVLRARANVPAGVPVEVEVDTLEQLERVLPLCPDVILLDNMDLAALRRAVAMRDEQSPFVLLEASGGVGLENVASIAATGVDRISVGALTHSAPALDVAFDWRSLGGTVADSARPAN